MECKTERNSYLVLFLKYIVVVRKGELVKFIDLLTRNGETSVVVNYCTTYIIHCVVLLRKEILIKHEVVKSNNRLTTQRTSHPQITCTLEKLVYKDKQVSSDIKGYENKEYLPE